MSKSENLLFQRGLRRSSIFPLSFLTLFLFLFVTVVESFGQNLFVMPRRVVFEGPKREPKEITLANTGKDTAKYIVSFVQIRMKEDGSFEVISKPDSGQNFADPFLRVFPRTVSLAPNESQVIKVQLTRTDKLTSGEYRSHLYFRSVPKQTALGEEEKPKDTSDVSAKLIPVFGITIPIIIRSGDVSAKVSLSNISLDLVSDTVPKLRMTFNRSGNMSVYGDIKIVYVPVQGKSVDVCLIKGFAVYTPATVRKFTCTLEKIPGVDYKTGKLRIIYSEPVDVKANSKLVDTEFLLN
jgi:hypothetical protein